MKKRMLLGLIIFFIILILFSGINLLLTFYDYQKGNELYLEIEEEIITLEEDKLEIDFIELEKINKDVVGWIEIDNLGISYPIVLGSDNDYYLNHLIDRSYNGVGSIYMDYRNSYNFNDRHTIIYGHNLQNGTMFSNLEKYKSQSYYDENPYYLLATKEETYKVEIVSGYVTNVNDISWNLEMSDNEFDNWIKYTLDKSIFKSKTVVNISDRFITLSTCSYDFKNARYVLVGVIR